MTTYILTFYSSLSANDRYRMRDENGTAISDADLATIFGSDGKARFILDWDGKRSESPLRIQIRNSSNTVVISHTTQKALLPAQLYEGTWTGGASTFTSFTPVEGKTLSEDQLSFLMEQIKSAQASGIKTLTTADYDYPAGNPTQVALWLLDSGIYKIGETMNVRGLSGATGLNVNVGDIIIISKSSTLTKALVLSTADNNRVKIFNATPTGGDSSYSTIVGAQDVITARDVGDTLTSTDNRIPLSAKQGKVLKDLIDSLVIKNAGTPTTATVGTVGKLLEDTTNGKLYQCTAIDNTDPQNIVYTWTEIGAGGGSSVQSDWNQNDPEAADYIKNRIAYPTQSVSKSLDVTEYDWGGYSGYVSGTVTPEALKTAMMAQGWTSAQADFYIAHHAYYSNAAPAAEVEYEYNYYPAVFSQWSANERMSALSEADASQFKNIPVKSVRLQFTDIFGSDRDVTVNLSKLPNDTSTDGFILFGYACYGNVSWDVDSVAVTAWQDSQIGLAIFANTLSGMNQGNQIASGTATIVTQDKIIEAALLPDATASVKGAVTLGQIGGAVQNGDYLRKYTTGQGLTALDLRQAPIVDWDSSSLTSPETIKNKPFGSIPAGTTYPFRYISEWYTIDPISITSTGDAAAQWLGVDQTALDNAVNNTVYTLGESGNYYQTFNRSVSFYVQYCEALDTLANAIDSGSAPTLSVTGTWEDRMEGMTKNISFSFSGFTKGADGIYRSAPNYLPYAEFGNATYYSGMAFQKTATGYNVSILGATMRALDPTVIDDLFPYGSGQGNYLLTWTITTTAAGVNQIDASYIPLDMTVFQIVDGKITLRNP